MVKVAEVRDACYVPSPLHGSSVRRVFGKRQVWADQVVVIHVRGQHAPQVRFVEDDQVVEVAVGGRFRLNSVGMIRRLATLDLGIAMLAEEIVAEELVE